MTMRLAGSIDTKKSLEILLLVGYYCYLFSVEDKSYVEQLDKASIQMKFQTVERVQWIY